VFFFPVLTKDPLLVLPNKKRIILSLFYCIYLQ